MHSRGTNSKRIGIKILIVLLIVALLSIIIYFDRKDNWTGNYLDWVEKNPLLGSVSYILVYMAVTVLFVPGLIFSVGCGYVYSQAYNVVVGVLLGSVIVFIGASLGSIAAFLIGRYLFESLIKSWVEKYEKFAAIQRVTQKNGLRLLFLLRLSPIIPFNVLNYAMGLTSIKLRDYTIACIGMAPATIAFVFLGTTITTISEATDQGLSSNVGVLIFAIVGTFLAFIGLIWVSAAAKREIKGLTENSEEEGMVDKKTDNIALSASSEELVKLKSKWSYTHIS